MNAIATQVYVAISKEEKVKAMKAAGPSIGQRSRELIKEGKSNAVVLETIKLEFPEGKTTMACIAWYKSDLRKKGEIAPRGHVAVTMYKMEDGSLLSEEEYKALQEAQQE